MKRWIPIGVVLVLVILAFGLCATAWNPGAIRRGLVLRRNRGAVPVSGRAGQLRTA